MSSDIEIIDGAVPLVRNEPWEWFAVFFEDPSETTPTDLSGDVVFVDVEPLRTDSGAIVMTGTADTVAAEIRWEQGSQSVTVEVVDAVGGEVRLSLTAVQTAAMPLGRLSKLYIAIDAGTEAIVPVEVIEGLYDG
jgi:hypothetical protein